LYMEGISGRCVRTYGGVCDLATKKFGEHSLGRVDAFLAHSRTRMREFVNRLHHRFIEIAENID
jgi:hypothetical protein